MSEIEKMYENCEIYPDCRARDVSIRVKEFIKMSKEFAKNNYK